MRKLVLGFVLACFLLVTSPSVLADSIIYDDFSGSTLNLSKWNETTIAGFPDVHLVNTTEQRYHVVQFSPSGIGTDIHLIMTKGLTDETIEYDIIYVSGSGNHLSNFGFAPYGSVPWCSGNCYIGYWNAPGLWGSQPGTYHIKIDFNSSQKKADISIKRPDGTYWTSVADLSVTTPPYYLLVQASTGHDGLMHFDYDNFVISNDTTPSHWWNDSWSCRAPINISVSLGTTQQNYQVLLNISYDTYNCSGKAQADFDDLRFINGSDNSELDYWVEYNASSDYANVWVEIDQNITTTDYTIYMYYGNSNVSTTSNGINTFEYYHGACTDCYFTSPDSYGDNYSMRAKIYEDVHNRWWGFTDTGTDPREIIYYDVTECPAVGSNLCYYSATTGHETLGGDFADQLHIFEITRNGTTNVITTVDDANLITHAYQSQKTRVNTGGPDNFGTFYPTKQVDWFLVRKWHYPEPTYSVGLEMNWSPANLSVAYWKFDEGTGNIAHDETGNHDGTIVGALWTSGINGTGLLFDGLDDSLCVDDSDDLDLKNQGTLEAWIKTPGNGDYYSIICKAIGWKYHEFTYCFEWDKPVWGGRLLLVFDDGVNQQELISNTPILDNEFHHVAATWDGNTINIFIDGELDASIEQQVIPRSTDYPLCVGNLGGSMNSFEGVIDEVRISNVALESSEFLYPPPSIPTIAYWKFDEGSGTIAHDETGFHNGTLVNGPIWTIGIIGSALWFDGINDYVVVPDSSSFSQLNQMTVEALIKLDSFNPGVKHIVGKADGRPYHPGDEWSLQILDHTIAFYVSNGSTIYSSLFRAEAEANETDTWYYITGVWNGTNFALYINDKLADSGTSLQGTSQDSNVPVYIGAMPDWSWTFFDGIIDEVRISNKALDPSEFLYQPSCDNGVQDGDEEGIDCGGSCPEPCPLTLEERVEQLEQENLNQQQQIMNLTLKNEILQEDIETLKNQTQNNTQRISALEILVSGLQATINTIQEILSNIVNEIAQTIANYLSNLPKGLRQQMICGALEQTNITNSTGFGLYCEINEKGCECQNL